MGEITEIRLVAVVETKTSLMEGNSYRTLSKRESEPPDEQMLFNVTKTRNGGLIVSSKIKLYPDTDIKSKISEMMEACKKEVLYLEDFETDAVPYITL